ncbi:cell surface glycoprotein [Schizosaccharomyces osmophilus]|uniref:Cell surface glycoprotein n=1 Tax=Schizosaccharomyces osmophilus TaxID=2545709 RepID=A0AAE9WF72_9SCHI|nr:cell surface glycoprotein [Schizosaccharomyces osmophilus]WBW74668.1 cell surface glycoprotein [Schizosaccharomyces osmophilus]
MQTSLELPTNKVNGMDMRSLRMENKDLRVRGYAVEPVPFLNGNSPDFDLPRNTCIQDIDRLSKNECIRYMNGYGRLIGAHETIALKRKFAMLSAWCWISTKSILFPDSQALRY